MNEKQIPEVLLKKRNRVLMNLIGVTLGLLLGTFLTFFTLFLYRVLPHGGL